MGRGIKMIVLIILIVILTTALSFAFSNDEETILEELACERLDTLDKFYKNEIDEYEAVKLLERVETGYLLEYDVDNLKSYFSTDIEQVNEYRIIGTYIKEADDTVIIGKITFRWSISGLYGKEKLDVTYSVICEDEGEGFKIVHFYS